MIFEIMEKIRWHRHEEPQTKVTLWCVSNGVTKEGNNSAHLAIGN